MTSKRSKLQEYTYFLVHPLLQKNPETSQRELTRVAGASVGSMNYVLSALVDRGLVKLGNFTAAEDRWRYLYLLTPKGIATNASLTFVFLICMM